MPARLSQPAMTPDQGTPTKTRATPVKTGALDDTPSKRVTRARTRQDSEMSDSSIVSVEVQRPTRKRRVSDSLDTLIASTNKRKLPQSLSVH